MSQEIDPRELSFGEKMEKLRSAVDNVTATRTSMANEENDVARHIMRVVHWKKQLEREIDELIELMQTLFGVDIRDMGMREKARLALTISAWVKEEPTSPADPVFGIDLAKAGELEVDDF